MDEGFLRLSKEAENDAVLVQTIVAFASVCDADEHVDGVRSEIFNLWGQNSYYPRTDSRRINILEYSIFASVPS